MNRLAKKTSASTSFDYEMLDFESRVAIQQRTGEIREQLRRSAQDIWEIGQKLVDVRSRLKHGQFETWLKTEFDWSRRTAYNFINVYETFRERANLAQIDIATSALYLLAAPSTSQDTREAYLQQAREGRKVVYQDLRKALKEERPKSAPVSTLPESPKPISKPEIIAVISKAASEVEIPTVVNNQTLELHPTVLAKTSTGRIQPGWYCLEKRHLLFCGDTASSQFSEHIPPETALAIAITSNDWDHDWLIDRARSVIILSELDLKENLVEQLLSMFSHPGEIVVFPWLPSKDVIAVAHRLKRQVLAGDCIPERCDAAIADSGLRVEPISL